jgi:hypothetical protein
MNKEDIELIRHYLVTLEKTITSNINSVNAIRETLIELLPEFQDSYRVKYEALVQRTIEAADSSDFSAPSGLDLIIRILQACD